MTRWEKFYNKIIKQNYKLLKQSCLEENVANSPQYQIDME